MCVFCVGKRKRSGCYLYELNDRMEDNDQCKSGKKCEDLIGKVFPSPLHIMRRDNNAHHQIKKDQIRLNHKFFCEPI